jgi:hypothetical protein
MFVQTYSRLPYGPTDAAEQLVLQRIHSVLERRGEDAVILLNLFHGRHEIDLVVATQTATLVIEVKGYRQAVEGDINSRSWKTVASGERRSNAYAKIDSAHMDLKDALQAMTGADPGYAHAVVLLAYGVPVGSNLPQSDHRVTITDIEALEGLLSTPVRPGTMRRLWRLDVVRAFAVAKGLAVMPRAMNTANTACAPAAEAGYAAVPRAVETLAPMASATPQVIERSAPLVLEAAPISRPKKRSWLRAAILLFIGLPILAEGVSALLQRPDNKLPEAASALRHAHRLSRRHAGAALASKGRIERAQQESSESSSALLAAQKANDQALAGRAVPPTPAASLPPCPSGIDRLGCVPDPQTLAKLRGH